MLAAADFVHLAEQSYLMSELTDQVIGRALDQAAKWWVDGLRIEVSVNIPARDLLSSRLGDLISRELQRRGLPASALRLDIDEQVLSGKSEQAASTVRALADLGVGVSLDDFGTGNSSLALLTRLGISEIKLAPTLIAELPAYREKSVSVASLVSLARTLGIRSIAEGVEADAVATALLAVGCDGAQGWLFARPMTADQATSWLTENFDPAWAGAVGAHGQPDAAGCGQQPERSPQPGIGPGIGPGGRPGLELAGGRDAGPDGGPGHEPDGWQQAELARATPGA
jgi:EAL domain-containing protein (putative c-di-GMP-specific phosphodiesterase class I)